MLPSLPNALDAIPIVQSTADRTAKYPVPNNNQRTQNLATGTIDRWNGSAWVTDFTSTSGGGTTPTGGNLQIVLTTAARNALNPALYQTVFNVQTGNIEMWAGTAWITIVTGSGGQVQFYNVLSFGATGLGQVDDTDAIQACINAAGGPAGVRTGIAGIVYVPPGIYETTGTLALGANMYFGGVPKLSILTGNVSSGFAVAIPPSTNFSTIEGITIAPASAGAGGGISVGTGCQFTNIRRNWITVPSVAGTPQGAVVCHTPCTIEDNVIEGGGAPGIQAFGFQSGGTPADYPAGYIIKGNTVQLASTAGIYVVGTVNPIVDGNFVIGNFLQIGIDVSGSSFATVVNNYIQESTNAILATSNSYDLTIANNQIVYTTGSAIVCNGVNNSGAAAPISITGNKIAEFNTANSGAGPGSNAIEVVSCQQVVVMGNTATSSTTLGRALLYSSGNVQVTAVGNIASGTTGPAIVSTGDTSFEQHANLGGSLAAASGGIVTLGQIVQARATLTYGTTVTPNAASANYQMLNVTNATAFTFANPTNTWAATTAAGTLTFEILNSSGGAMGTITWGTLYLLAGGAFTNPGTGKRRVITFAWNGTNYVEQTRSSADT